MGPVRSWSMFKYERFNSWICRRVTNRANPEATVIKTYQVIEEKHTLYITLQQTFLLVLMFLFSDL